MSLTAGVGAFRWSLLLTVGVPLLLVLFYLDGLVVGKVLPRGALFVAYVALVTPSTSTLVGLVVACAVAATLGQWTLYRGLNDERPELIGLQRRVGVLRRAPLVLRDRIGQRRLVVVTRTFERFGGAAILATNAVPIVRSLVTIPAGVSRYPVGRFVAYSLAGNLCYLGLLSVLAKGALELVRIVPVP